MLAVGFSKTSSFLPGPLKRVWSWFVDDSKLIRKYFKEARDILAPILENRKQAKAEAERKGKSAPVYNDMLEWLEQEGQTDVSNLVACQMLLSVAAIHTTSELLNQTMLHLASDPRHIEDLRKEIIEVLTADGLSKAALSNLKLMDSAIKETQRLTPVSYLSMRRIAAEKVTLADGTVINKGDYTVVNGKTMADPQIWLEPEKYDIYRYYRLRQDPVTANKAHLVSTSPNHMGFGHGDQACPGRFFAANEIKIAICHLLLKYDWELAPGANVAPVHAFAETMTIDPNNKVRFRRRREELDLESLFSK